MNDFEYGGYLPLEINQNFSELYQSNSEWNVVALNSGRAAFYLAARLSRFKKVFIPYYTCPVIDEPFRKLGLKVEKYYLDSNLLPINDSFSNDDLMLWTNYYGNAQNREIDEVCSRFSNLIIDNCHAFFTPPRKGVMNCYSTRKFFGVPDGGYLVTDKLINSKDMKRDESFRYYAHLLQQIDCGTNEGYSESLKNEARLTDNYSLMSKLTNTMLHSIDYEEIQKIRWNNFSMMHEILGDRNEFKINLESRTHMYYPFKSYVKDLRQNLLKSKIYTPFWWRHVLKEVPKTSIEYDLALNTIPLPIDQRYNQRDIEIICEKVKSYL